MRLASYTTPLVTLLLLASGGVTQAAPIILDYSSFGVYANEGSLDYLQDVSGAYDRERSPRVGGSA